MIERVKNECLRADDVWLKVMEMLAETKVTWTRCLLIVPPDVKQNQSIGLAQGNVNRNQNDIYMICMLVIGLTENGIFDVTFNFALLYLVKVLVSDKTIIRKEVKEFMEYSFSLFQRC